MLIIPKSFPVNDENSRLQDIENALSVALLDRPAAPVITPFPAGATSYSYVIVPVFGYNNPITGLASQGQGSPAGSTTTGPATLGSAGANNLITWAAVLNASYYLVYRSVGGATQGLIGSTQATSFVDTGLAGDATTASVFNRSGVLKATLQEPVLILSADGAITQFGVTMVTKGTAAAITLVQPIAGLIHLGGDDGRYIEVVDTVGAAHTITTASNGINGNKHIATFGGTVGTFAVLVAYNGVWWSMPLTGIVLS